MLRTALLVGFFLLWPATGPAQEPIQPGDLPPEIEIPLKQMRFDHATRIQAVFLYLDTYDDAIWVEWTAVHDGKRWYGISGQRQFIVYPASPEMFLSFKAFPKGTVIRMTIQRDKDGKRRILFLESA